MSSSKATAKTYAEGPGVKVDREICGTRPVEGIEPGESPHKLTEEEERMLARQRGHELSASMQARIEREAMLKWDRFYKRNENRFFKDRHWLLQEFDILTKEETKCVLEVGCGVGNTVFPLLEARPGIFVHCCDFSPKAVELVKEHSAYSEAHSNAFVCDLTQDALPPSVLAATPPAPSTIDAITLLFVLSAIHPDRMVASLANIRSVMSPTTRLLFRDYGLHDHAQLRFTAPNRLGENFYVRSDGTRAYYFSLADVERLAHDAGLVVDSLAYHVGETVNRAKGLRVDRVFVQAVLRLK